jgi:hypothetical protein
MGSQETAALTDFLSRAELKIRELDDVVTLPNLTPDEQTAYLKARSYYKTLSDMEDGLANMLREETKGITEAMLGNLAVTATSAMTGNMASVGFNATQYGARTVWQRLKGQPQLLGALKKLQGQAQGNLNQSIMQRMSTFAAAAVKEGFKEGAGETVSSMIEEYGMENEDFRKYSVEMANAIADAAGNPMGYAQLISDNFGDTFDGNPAGGSAATESAARIREILMRELPTTVRQGILDPKSMAPEHSDMDKEKTQEIFTAMYDPVTVLTDPRPGHEPTQKQIRLISEAYPNLMRIQAEKILEEVAKEKMKGRDISPEKRQKLVLYLGGGSNEEDPKYHLRLQALHQEMNQRAEAPPSRPSSSFGKSLSKAAQTTAERVGNL